MDLWSISLKFELGNVGFDFYFSIIYFLHLGSYEGDGCSFRIDEDSMY